MTHDPWSRLLRELKSTFERNDAFQSFCEFPDDLKAQEVIPHHAPCADYLKDKAGLDGQTYCEFIDAIVAAGPQAHWRETYKNTDIGLDFMSRFGCYAIIGTGGAFVSSQLWAFIVHMPKQLDYPFHHHPAEEMYVVLSGEAEFMREGEPNEVLREGDTSFHASNQPHAMKTHDHPVLCLVVWRNGFETLPKLTTS